MSNVPSLVALVFFAIVVSACGVKGKPSPPLTAPVLGRGEPNFSKATENVKLKRKPRPSDWEESAEFPEEKGP